MVRGARFHVLRTNEVICVCSFNVKASLTKVEGQGVTVSNKECVPTVSGALVGTKANSSVTALQASSQRWVPPHIIKDSEKSNDAVFRRVRGILNKLTPEKFDKLTSELLHVGINTKFILKGIILLVFEKALDEPKFSSLYAQLCLRFTELAPNFDDPGKAGHSTFRRLLLKQCEEEFNSRSTASAALDKKDGVLSSEEEEQRAIIKRKMLGNIKFIGELGKLGMLHEAILHKCIKQLLDKKKRATMADISEDMECLCHLMKTVGSQIDVLKARPLMNQYFDRIQHILDNTELPSRIRFMLQDILELRKNKWVPRRADQENSAPRPIQQIRQEAWQGKKGSMHHDHRHMMHHHGDPTFNYGLRHKRGHHHKATAGRGFDDIFMTDTSFDSFLPMDDFGHLRMNNDPFGAQNFSARFNDLPPVRPFKEDDPYFSSMRSRNSPPDFLPNYQTGLKKTQPQPNEGRPRRIGQKPQRLTPDGEISLRPARESFVAQPTPTASRGGTTSSLSNNQTKTTSANSSDRSNASSVPDKSKPVKQTPVVPKVDTEKAVVTITEEFVKSKNMTEAIKSVKELNSSQFMDLLTTKLLETILQKSEEEHHLVGELFEKLFEEKLMTKEILTKGFDSFIRNLGNSEKESDVIKMSLAKLSAKFIVKGVFDLEPLSKAMEPVDVLFLQCLKEVKEDKGEGWLLETFDKSEVNLLASLTEANRNNEKMTEILQQQGLIFLSPLLKARADLFAEIQNDPNVSSLYKWIKDNIDVKLHSSASFANVLTTCVLKYVTMTTSLGPGIDPKQTIEKNIQDQEKAAMENMKPLLQKFLNDNVPLQVSALYALQVFCHCNDFPKGLLLRMFVMLYDFEIIEEDAFISWKEDVNEEHPGKGRALFQVNAWLTWLETAAEESSESEPE